MSQLEHDEFDQTIKNTLYHLYVVNNTRLPGPEGLLKIMEVKHGFKRTTAQYHKLFERWGWKKKKSSNDYKALGEIIAERSKRGRETDVYSNGELVPRKKVQKEIARQGYLTTAQRIEHDRLQASSLYISPNTPLGFDLLTPLASGKPLQRLFFRNLPVLKFRDYAHGTLNSFFTSGPNEKRDETKSTEYWVSEVLGLHQSKESSTSLLNSIIPAILWDEPSTAESSPAKPKEASIEAPGVLSLLLSNKLPGIRDGELVYSWLKDHGGAAPLRGLYSIKEDSTVKAILESVFGLAIQAGDTPIVKFLLELGASPNEQRFTYAHLDHVEEMMSPLQLACAYGHFELVYLLLRCGSKIEETETGKLCSLVVLAIIGGNRGLRGHPHYPFMMPYGRDKARLTEIDDTLEIKRNNDQEDKDHKGSDDAGATECKDHCPGQERRSKGQQADIHTSSPVDELALLDLVKVLIEMGAKVNIVQGKTPDKSLSCTDDYPQSPLSAASKYLNLSVVKFLLKQGADVNFLTSQNTSALQECLYSWEEMSLHLYQWETDEQLDWLPLHQRWGPNWSKKPRAERTSSVGHCLLDAGANLWHATIYDFREPGHMAQSRCQLAELCVLDLAVLTGDKGLVEKLFTLGAAATDICLDLALSFSDISMCTILWENGAFAVSFEGLEILSKNSQFLREWIMLLQKGYVSPEIKKFAMIVAMACNSMELMDTTLQFAPFEWETLLVCEYTQTYEDEDGEGYVETEKELDINSCAGREFFKGYKHQGIFVDACQSSLFASAVVCCVRKSSVDVLRSIIFNNVLQRNLLIPYITTALHYAIVTERDTRSKRSRSVAVFQRGMVDGWSHPALEFDGLGLVNWLFGLGASVNGAFKIYHQSWCRTARNPSTVIDYPGTILVTAIECGNNKIIKEVLSRGADIDSVGLSIDVSGDLYTTTPLVAAILAGRHEWVNYFNEKGCARNELPSNTFTALGVAIMKADKSLINRLLARGARFNQADLAYAVNNLEILQMLLQDFEKNHQREIGRNIRSSALAEAIQNGSFQAVCLILQSGVLDVNSLFEGRRPLSYTLKFNTEAIDIFSLNMLLKWGANPNLSSNHIFAAEYYPTLPLHQAAAGGNYEMVQQLLQFGAKPNGTPNDSFLTALHVAVGRSITGIVRLLLENGATPNPPQFSEGRNITRATGTGQQPLLYDIILLGNKTTQRLCVSTPLQIAAMYGLLEIAEVLVKYGAIINAPAAENTGATALQYTAMNGYLAIAVLLIDNGANVNAPGAMIDGRTALEGAAEHGRIDMVQFLLNVGAEIYGEGHAQYTRALGFARRNGHNALADLLEEHHGPTDE